MQLVRGYSGRYPLLVAFCPIEGDDPVVDSRILPLLVDALWLRGVKEDGYPQD